jgi:putative nucleotidyltransferase with HDIG domain
VVIQLQGNDPKPAAELTHIVKKAAPLALSMVETIYGIIMTFKLPGMMLADANAPAKALLETPGLALARQSALELIHPDDQALFLAAFLRDLPPDRYAGSIKIRICPQPGRVLWLDMIGCQFHDDQAGQLLVTFSQDISEARIRTARFERALHVTGACNLELIRATDEKNLITNFCQKLVEIGGYRFVWMGYVDHDARQTLRPVAMAGYEAGYLTNANIALNDPVRSLGPSGRAIKSGRIYVCRDILKAPDFAPWREAASSRGYRSSIAIPMQNNHGEMLGVLNIYSTEAFDFDEEEQRRLSQIVSDLAFGITALRNYRGKVQAAADLEQSLEKLQRTMTQTVNALATVVEIRDPYTAGHQRKVTSLAVAIAREMGLGEDQVEAIFVAATLHDIGKISIPSEILSKPGKISDMELGLIRNHSQSGYEIIKSIEFPWPVAEIVLQHHERLNGSGYPRGLQGEKILLSARIIAVADVVEAMAADRPYRAAQGLDKALEEITMHRGDFYDPVVVDACNKLFSQSGFDLREDPDYQYNARNSYDSCLDCR